jgi:E3 ubiquitin-protein ligase RNF14
MPITLTTTAQVELDSTPSQASSSVVQPTLKIDHLPPISLTVHLPPAYPLNTPPSISKIHALIPSPIGDETVWLSRKYLTKLSTKLGEMWIEEKEMSGEGQGVLWKFWDWVGSGDFLYEVGLLSDGVLR